MRICITSLPLYTIGGAQRVIFADAQYFASQGHDVHLLSRAINPDVLSNYGLSEEVTLFEYETDSSTSLQFLSRARSIRQYIKSITPDVVITHYEEKATWLALSALKLDPVFITHVHGSLFWFQNSPNRVVHMHKQCAKDIVANIPGHSEFWSVENISIKGKLELVVLEILEWLALRDSDTIFVNTRQVADELNCLYGVHPEINPPGIDTQWKEHSVDKVTLPTDQPFILSVSRLDPRKRLDLLIRAFSVLRESRHDIELIIGGTGSEGDNLKQLADDQGVRDTVHFEGYIDEKTLPTYYDTAEVFACPGWMSYGLTPLEAVYSETKVALSTDTFAKEIIKDQSGVKVVKPDREKWTTALNVLIEDEEKPSTDTLPSSKEHAAKKLKIFNRYG